MCNCIDCVADDPRDLGPMCAHQRCETRIEDSAIREGRAVEHCNLCGQGPFCELHMTTGEDGEICLGCRDWLETETGKMWLVS